MPAALFLPPNCLLAPSRQWHRIPQAAWGPFFVAGVLSSSGERYRDLASFGPEPEVVLPGFSVMLGVLRSGRRCLTFHRSGRGSLCTRLRWSSWPRR